MEALFWVLCTAYFEETQHFAILCKERHTLFFLLALLTKIKGIWARGEKGQGILVLITWSSSFLISPHSSSPNDMYKQGKHLLCAFNALSLSCTAKLTHVSQKNFLFLDCLSEVCSFMELLVCIYSIKFNTWHASYKWSNIQNDANNTSVYQLCSFSV